MRQKMRYFLLLVGLLLSVSIGAQTVKWRDIYTVKKKDTIFGIANKYGLSFFFQAEDGIRISSVTGVQTCALPI